MEATARPAAVAELFRDAFLSEETGRLDISAPGRTFSIVFDRGLVGAVQVDPPPPGSSPTSLEPSEIVKAAFGCPVEHVEFLAGEAPRGEPIADLLQTAGLFLLGVQSMTGFDEIREALQSMSNGLVLRQNPAIPLDRLALRPVHGFMLSRLGSGLSFGEAVSTAGPDEEEESARFIFGLLMLGCVGFDPPLGHGLFRTETLLMDHRRDFAREESQIAFIRDMDKKMQGQNLGQILGVHERSTPEEIRRAYDDLRRTLAAERFLSRVRESMRTELAAIEARLTQIFLTLQSRAQLRPLVPVMESIDLHAATLRRELTKTGVAASANEGVQLAEGYYMTAKKYFAERDFFNCIQYCTQAIRQNDQVARYYMLLGEAQSRNPDRRWQKMAEQSFLNGCRLDPWSADFLTTLGQFYRKHGFAARARRQFERAIELQPGHATANEELKTLT